MVKKANRRQKLGRKSEELVVRWLERNGFRILARNFRYYTGEIDIIVVRKGVVNFVEVRSKMLRKGSFRSSSWNVEESISRKKLQRIMLTGQVFLRKQGMADLDVNILIVAVNWYNSTHPKIRVIPVY